MIATLKSTLKYATISTLLVVTSLVTNVSTATADAEFNGNAITVNRVSGESRADHQIYLIGYLGDNNGYINRVGAAEKSDDPCWMNILKKALPGQPAATGGNIGFGCANSTLRSHKNLNVPSGKYITGMRMCRRDGNRASTKNLMKGLELKLGQLRSNNSIASAGTLKFQRPNCKKWSAWSSCPSGAILIAIKAHMRAGSSEKGNVVGLQSVCKKIRNT